MIDGGIEAVTGGGIVMGIINALRKQGPGNSRTEGRGMADRGREDFRALCLVLAYFQADWPVLKFTVTGFEPDLLSAWMSRRVRLQRRQRERPPNWEFEHPLWMFSC
jgi:hypothetical protein